MQAKGPDVGGVHAAGDFGFHVGLDGVVAVGLGLEHQGGGFEVGAADADGQGAGGAAELADGVGGPGDDFIEDGLYTVFVEDAVGLGADGRAAAEHQDVEAEARARTATDQDGGGFDASAVGIQATGLVDAFAVAAHDAHGAAGKGAQAGGDAFADGVEQASGDGGVVADFQQEVRDAAVVAEGTAVLFGA